MPKTGATRYQKFLKSEKSKTKLKSKKDLPKGTNITKTSFKAKKIVIKSQLRKHGDAEALSSRKLNVKELLSRLNHFNTPSRIDALNGLKELITSYPTVLEHNLGDLIHGITPLILNIEKNVRHESLKVLHLMLFNIDIGRVDPFFDILCTYLRSAMTHIDVRIQEDSLLFLDTLLICTPKHVAQDFHKIIPNFLDMISKLRVDSKPGRTLTVNLGSQMTSVKWRVKVLHRLKDYLNQYVEYNNIHEKKENVIKANVKIFDPTEMNYYPLSNASYWQTCNISCFSSKYLQDIKQFDEVEKFNMYVDTLMPLLFETWLEVCPNVQLQKNIETVISEDAASLLKQALDVFSLIWCLVVHFNIQKAFSQKYRQPILQHFVSMFPYVTNIRSKQRKIGNSTFEDLITDPKLVEQNLEICNLFILLNPNVSVKNQSKDISSVLNYIQKTFQYNTHKKKIFDIIIKILHTIFSDDLSNWTRNLSIMDTLFNKLIEVYFNQERSSSIRQQVFSLLCKIALNEKLSHFHKCEFFNTWLSKLPDILLEKEVTADTVNIIHKLAIRSNSKFNSVIKPKFLTILENLPKLQVSDSEDPSIYYKLFSLLHYTKVWDTNSLNLLENQLKDHVYGNRDYGSHLFDTIRRQADQVMAEQVVDT